VRARGAQPYLGARTWRSGDKMIDRVWFPRVVACGRSVSQGRPGRWGWRRGVWGSRPQSIFVTTGVKDPGFLGGSALPPVRWSRVS
jgi:hypothetical protein